MARGWEQTLNEFAQREPERFLANPRSFETVDEVVRSSIATQQRRLEDLALALDGSNFDSTEAFERLARIPPMVDPAQFQREAIRVIHETLEVPSAPAGFVDFGEFAARDVQRRELEQQILDVITGISAHDYTVKMLGRVIQKGGIEAAEALIEGLQNGTLLPGSPADLDANDPMAEPRPTPTPSGSTSNVSR